MSDQMLTLLKFGVLSLLYLFFAWALWAVWSEVRSWRAESASTGPGDRAPREGSRGPAASASAPASGSAAEEQAPPAPALTGAAAGGAAPSSLLTPKEPEPGVRRAAPPSTFADSAPPDLPVGALVIVEPPEQAGVRYPLGRELTIGRAAGCGVSIDDTFVSQLHARVYAAQNAWMVEDLDSTNGTILNGEQLVQATVLRQGDQIRLGSTVLELG